MDGKQALKILNEAYKLLIENGQDPESWLYTRMKSISSVGLNEFNQLTLRIDLESRCMGLLLEALKSKDVKKTETKGE